MASLLNILKRQLQTTFDINIGIEDISDYVISDEGLEKFYKDMSFTCEVNSYNKDGGVLLNFDNDYRAVIYYSKKLIKNLEKNNPLLKLDSNNWTDFMVFVEELDYFLVIAEKVKKQQEFSLLELELHANVSKYQTAKHYLAMLNGKEHVLNDLSFVKQLVFIPDKDFVEANHDISFRYETAKNLALKFVSHIDKLEYQEKLQQLRYFHNLPTRKKLNHIDLRM